MRIPDHDLFLSPWMKYKRYGKIPYKLLLNLVLCLLLLIQLVFILSHQVNNERQIIENIKTQLNFNDGRDLDVGSVGETVHRLDTFIDKYSTFVSSFRSINAPNDGFLHFMSVSPPSVYITRSRMYTFEEIESLRTPPVFDIHESYTITDEYPADYPFSRYTDRNDLRAYVNSISEIVVSFQCSLRDRHFGLFDLEINATFSVVPSSFISINTSHKVLQVVTEDSIKTTPPMLPLSLLIMILSLANLVLILRSMLRRVRLIRYIRAKHPNVASVKEMGTAKFIDSWLVVNFASAVFNIGCESFFIFPGEFREKIAKVLFSIALFLAFFVMSGYFEWSVEYYGLTLTVASSIKDITLFLIGQSPIFFAFALSGTVFFGGDTAKFRNIDQTSVTLFALLNGDVVRDTFNATYGMGTLGRVYTYLFVTFFIFAAVNVFRSILRSEYIKHQKEKKHKKGKQKDLENFPVHLRYRLKFMKILKDLE